MSKKKKQKTADRQRRSQEPEIKESRAAEAVTVAWTLTMTATLAGEVLGLLGWGLLWLARDAEIPDTVRIVPGLLMVTSALSGIVCLSLIPAVYTLRRVAPPKAITIFSAVVSLIPITIMMALSFRG